MRKLAGLTSFILLLTRGFSQVTDSLSYQPFLPDTNLVIEVSSRYSYCPDLEIEHRADSTDTVICKKLRYLSEKDPDKKNYPDYYELARALWEMNEVAVAEKMFLVIVNSNEAFYTDSYYHSSDVAGDTSVNLYGYGSYTSNFKHYACTYLTQVYLEKRQYQQALNYLKLADKKYPPSYSCGTGYMSYRAFMYGLYSLCYEGLGQDREIVKMLLPDCFESCTRSLTRALKRMYPGEAMQRELAKAAKSIVFVQNEKETVAYRVYNWGQPDKYEEEYRYLSGKATMMLFGYKVELPEPILEGGQKATKEMFVAEMLKTDFYRRLKGELD